MKLFAKYSRVNIAASIGALLLGSVAYYFIVRYVLIHQLDDTLKVEEAEIIDFVRIRGKLPEPTNYRDQQIRFLPAVHPVERKFLHTTEFSGRHREDRSYRELSFPVSVEGRFYTASVRYSEEETEDLLQLMMLITAAMVLLLLVILFLANRLVLRRIWQPFYVTLEEIRRFSLSDRKPFSDNPTDIDEFRSLDATAREMAGQIQKDYETIKNFADNASHEMQTPLAIINSKLDLMIQDPALEQRHHQPIQAMYDAIGRLRHLNQSLLLLTKIENNQFNTTGDQDLAILVREKLIELDDRIRDRGLSVNAALDKVLIPINSYLADILLNNLLTNAIRHNRDKGYIDIHLHDGVFCICNSGAALSFDAATIFDRFTKGAHSGGTGLGLAIVRQICENYGFTATFQSDSEKHTIEIRFPGENGKTTGVNSLQNVNKIPH